MRFSPPRRSALLALAACAALTVTPARALESTPRSRATFPAAVQPRLAVAGPDRVFLAYGHGSEVFVVRSDDRGATFGAPVKVATVPGLMLGLRRGPRIVARGDIVTVTLNAKDLLAFTSNDAGRTWSDPVTVNDVPASAREGLHDLALSQTGRVFITWLDLRLGKMALFAAESSDAGRTWTPNTPLYRSPEISICECCHPTAHYDSAGNLAVMWRNWLDGSRDLWLMTRAANAPAFSAPVKQGEGTWKLKGCPMDGGDLFARGAGAFASVWQRDGQIFLAAPGNAEIGLGAGKQPVAASSTAGSLILWQRGADLWSAHLSAALTPGAPALHAVGARFAVVAALPDGDGAVLAYEQGPAKGPVSVVVERL